MLLKRGRVEKRDERGEEEARDEAQRRGARRRRDEKRGERRGELLRGEDEQPRDARRVESHMQTREREARPIVSDLLSCPIVSDGIWF